MSLTADVREMVAILVLPVLLIFSFTHTCWTGTCYRTFGAGLVPGMGLIEFVVEAYRWVSTDVATAVADGGEA